MKYIILDDNYQSGHILMKDIEEREDTVIIYKDKLADNRLQNMLYRIFLSQKIKKYIPFFINKYWYSRLFRNVCTDEKLCFVMITAWYNEQFVEWLKKRYQNASFVLIFRDTVASNLKRNLGLKISTLNQEFDLIFSYDQSDVKKYSFTFSPVYISKMDEEDIAQYPESDLCFIGAAKDRLKQIQKIGKIITDHAGIVDFYLLNVPLEFQIEIPGVIYGTATMDRLECLSRELSSNCILEVLKGDAHANTLRFWEAVIYNKKFITNWTGVKESQYYNESYMKYYERPEDIDIRFITRKENVDYHYNNDLSPLRLLESIEKYLGNSNDSQ